MQKWGFGACVIVASFYLKGRKLLTVYIIRWMLVNKFFSSIFCRLVENFRQHFVKLRRPVKNARHA